MDITPTVLRKNILEMARVVEASIQGALDLSKTIPDIMELEKKVNEYHMQIDDICFKFIALKGPTAKDLRTAIAIMKINTDLERMGDEAIKIKRNQMSLMKEVPILTNMAIEVNFMVTNALESLVKSNTKLATDVIIHDEEVNNFHKDIARSYINMIKNNEISFDEGYNILRISKNLERIGDHAKNIAEDVIFLESGSDIRHHFEKKNN